MKAPDKIYIQQDMINNLILEEGEYADDVEYICKEALLGWAKEKQYESLTIVADNFWQEVIDKLNKM